VSERGAPFTVAGFAKVVGRAGQAAKIGFNVHPHMLRYAYGFALANKGHDTRSLHRRDWAIETSSTPSDIPSCRLTDSRIFGGTEPGAHSAPGVFMEIDSG
jgi:hypothetical protein